MSAVCVAVVGSTRARTRDRGSRRKLVARSIARELVKKDVQNNEKNDKTMYITTFPKGDVCWHGSTDMLCESLVSSMIYCADLLENIYWSLRNCFIRLVRVVTQIRYPDGS